MHIPNASQKDVLFKAGLEERKICFSLDDSESEVMEKITSDAVDSNHNYIGFPKLKTCGGFELLKCRQNCRELSIIDCQWNARNLKLYLGSQARIYVRPIQQQLSVEPVRDTCDEEQPQVHCHGCRQMCSVKKLREHLLVCDAEELPALDLNIKNIVSEQRDALDDQLPDLDLDEVFKSVVNTESIESLNTAILSNVTMTTCPSTSNENVTQEQVTDDSQRLIV
jgi:hypothetical protein